MNKSVMKGNKFLRYVLVATTIIVISWTVLTIYVELEGPAKEWNLGNEDGPKVLIVFDPDPFYNLDEKVCVSFGKALSENKVNVKIVTVAAAERLDRKQYNTFIYCANTYNWRPDWSITNYIENHPAQEHQSIVAVTLGAGSTESSQKNFEQVILDSGGTLLNSYSLWLWRPNDETKMKKPNVEVAQHMAYEWGIEIANHINK